ncbi:aminotransferase class V-fold PLP-dependent enzyme, partial [Flavobacteriales bacterium]|nr:aminotransferase class V-fold PLP-dependent enzyme [Flavobacteriales bacterium]
LKIDGVSAKDKTTEEVSKALKGEPNTEVKLLIERRGENPFNVVFNREKISVKSVPYSAFIDDNIAYLKLRSFTRNCTKDIKRELQVLQKDKNIEGIVLDIRNTGVNQKLIMYASDNAHYSIAKNASFSGIGRDNVRYIKSNSFGCLDVKLLEEAINIDLKRGYIPFYINATAGTTVLGAFDNIKGISKISKKYKLWLHVDGAWGGAVLFSKSYNKLIAGVENSDSFCFNAHKSLGVPLSSSVLLVADKKDLYNSFSNEASYLYQTHDNDYNLGQTSFECGRRNNSLKLWTMWKAIGTSGISKVIDHQFTLADYARSYVRGSKDYKLYSFDDSLSICFNYKSYDPEDLCTKLYDLNRLMIGFGFFGKQSFIRLVIINSSNSEKEIFNFFKIIEEFTLEHHKSIKSIDI